MIAIYALFMILLIAFMLLFMAFLPGEPETVSVFKDEVKEKKGSNLSPLLALFAPVNKIFIRMFRLEKPLRHKFYLAKWRVTPEEFLSGKELLAIPLPITLYLFNIKNPWWLIGAGLFGFILPDLILRSRVKRCKFLIGRVLPETIDLLGLCVGAGLDFMAAVRWVVEKVKLNPMIEELILVLKEINVGKPRVQALRDMSKRVDIADVTSFVRILIQADRMGTPVEDTFRILSEDTRIRRFHRGERQAMKAPLKMLIPLIFFILPVILIIVAGPILIRFIKQGFMPTLR
jgi:tight adherence protein C